MMREMVGDAPRIEHFISFSTGPTPPPPTWPAIAMAAAVFLAAVALAWRRRRAVVSERPRRLTRMIVAASVGGGGGALIRMALSGTIFPGVRGIDWDPFDPSPALVLAFRFLAYCLFAFMLVGTTDLLFDALRPRRSTNWLAIGVPLFAVFIIAILRATGWIEPLAVPPTPDQAILAVAALAAGLAWWSWLPAAWDPVFHVFE